MKLGLGTVQFGLDYGITNRSGRTGAEEVGLILETATRNGIRFIDTAALYGASEEVLGNTLPADHDFNLITKTIRFDAEKISAEDVSRLERAFASSLTKLHAASLYGLLIHNANDILVAGGEQLMAKLSDLKRQHLVEKVGISVYTSEQIDSILNRYEIDLIQLPVNVLDQRLLAGGKLSDLKAKGIEIHARSAFLQGVLLADPDSLPAHFDPVKPHLKRYHAVLKERGVSPVRAALGFLSSCADIDVIICGVDNHDQLMELCHEAGSPPDLDFSSFALDDESILSPPLWRVG